MYDDIGRAYITVDKIKVYNMCTLKRDYYRKPKEGVFSQVEFLDTAYKYLNTSIEESLKSKEILTQILVLLDSRIGLQF